DVQRSTSVLHAPPAFDEPAPQSSPKGTFHCGAERACTCCAHRTNPHLRALLLRARGRGSGNVTRALEQHRERGLVELRLARATLFRRARALSSLDRALCLALVALACGVSLTQVAH